MADMYTESSSSLEFPKGKEEEVKRILNATICVIEDEEDFCGCEVKIINEGKDKPYIWFHATNTDHVEQLARAVINALELDKPFFCSWANTCSKPALDCFGGGAFVIKRGYQTRWVDALTHVMQDSAANRLLPEED